MLAHCRALHYHYLLKHFAILLLLITFPSVRADDGTLAVSIGSEVAFSSQRDCGHGCLYNTDTVAAAAGINIEYQCSSNGCYCATQSSSLYSSFISSCWTYACYNLALGDPFSTITVDVSSALSIYNGYCATAYPQSVVATTTPNNGPTPVTTGSNGTSTSGSTPTATTSHSATPHSGLSSRAIAGLAGGITGGVTVGILLAVVLTFARRIRRKKRFAQTFGSPREPCRYSIGGRAYEKPELANTPLQVSEVDERFQTRQKTGQKSNNTQLNSRVISPVELDWAPHRAELEGDCIGGQHYSLHRTS